MNYQELIKEMNSILESFKEDPSEENVEVVLGKDGVFVTALRSVYDLDPSQQLPFLSEAEKIRQKILEMVLA
jgi:hypothetical protein